MRYAKLTNEQKLTLTEDQLDKAIVFEAIHRGLEFPLKIAELVPDSALRCHIPEEATEVYEIFISSAYARPEGTGIAFPTKAEAEKALEGAMQVTRDYSNRVKIDAPSFSLQITRIPLRAGKIVNASIDEYVADLSAYEALCDEIMTEIKQLRQVEYDKEILKSKKEEYLKLANNDEAVARQFWHKVEKVDWPC